MINLIVDEYCQHCPEFEPNVEKTNLYDGFGDSICDTEITCIHRERCRSIKEYIDGLGKERRDIE